MEEVVKRAQGQCSEAFVQSGGLGTGGSLEIMC